MSPTKTEVQSLCMDDAQPLLAADESIVLLDVRAPDEYAQGHLPRSINLPLGSAPTIGEIVPDKSARLFVYCLSGNRANRASQFFAKIGYTDVTNIGGINSYHGTLVTGA